MRRGDHLFGVVVTAIQIKRARHEIPMEKRPRQIVELGPVENSKDRRFEAVDIFESRQKRSHDVEDLPPSRIV